MWVGTVAGLRLYRSSQRLVFGLHWCASMADHKMHWTPTIGSTLERTLRVVALGVSVTLASACDTTPTVGADGSLGRPSLQDGGALNRDSPLPPDDISADFERSRAINRILQEAQNAVYECATDRGTIVFRRGAVAISEDSASLSFHPVVDRSEAHSCTDISQTWSGYRQKCVFYDDSRGRWGFRIHKLNELDGLPPTISQPITRREDCETYPLQEGVTVEECQAQYSCVRNLRPQIEKIHTDAQEVAYACDVRDGDSAKTVYFRYGYGAESVENDYLYFYPVFDAAGGSESCTDPTVTTTNGIQSCVFYGEDDAKRWSLFVGRPSKMGEFPRTLKQPIANTYDCDNHELREGVTPAMCKDEYTCTKVRNTDASSNEEIPPQPL